MPWVMLGAALAGGAVLGWWLPQEALEWNAPLVNQQPWRLMTASWCHLSAAHLAVNLVGTLVVMAYGRLAGCGLRESVAWLVAWPLTHALLLLQPELQRYAGLSGVLHAGVAVASLTLMLRYRGQHRLIGAAVVAGLLIKLALEKPWAAAVQTQPEWGIPIAVLAHATGAAAGLICGWVAWVTSSRHRNPTIA